MKRPGHCTTCGEEIREIVSKHTKGKLKGEPIQLGDWKDNAWRVRYSLSGGTIADITLCENCLESDPTEVWDAVKERFLWEEKHHSDLGRPERNPVQQKMVEDEVSRILGLSITQRVGMMMWKFNG